VVSGF